MGERHHLDDALTGADVVLTAQVLAAAIRLEWTDLVFCGNASTDGAGGVIPAALAELLGVPDLTGLTSLAIEQDSVRGTRSTNEGVATISADLPAVVSITDAFPSARFPKFKGISAAKKKPFQTVSLDDLNVAADSPDAPRTIMTSVVDRPPRAKGVKLIDDGAAALQLADYLFKNKLV